MIKSGKLSQALRSVAAYREFTLVLVLLVMVVLMTFVSPVFLSRGIVIRVITIFLY